MKARGFELNLKSLTEDGQFSGYGSLFNVLDSYHEQVAPGAFAASLAEREGKGRKFPVLWQHRTDQPIGVYQTVQEDAKGLFVQGKLLTADVNQAREAHALMKAGAVSGLSIGYWVRQSTFDEESGVRTLTKLDLEEISIVTMPALDAARVDTVKMKLAHGQLPSLSEFEAALRDAGWSRNQATAIASHGLKGLLREAAGEANNPSGLGAIVSHLRTFSLPK